MDVKVFVCIVINCQASTVYGIVAARITKSDPKKNFLKHQTSASRRGFFILQVHKTAEQLN